MKNGNGYENNLPEVNEGGENVYEANGKKLKSKAGKYTQPFWMDLLAIIGVYIVAYFFAWLVGYVVTQSTTADQSLTVFVTTLIQYPIVIVFAIWLLRMRGMADSLLSFSLRRSDPAMILWGILVIVAMSIVIEPLLALFPVENMAPMRRYVLEGGGLTMFTVIVLAPLLEEMLFRGVIQESASRFYGPLAGVLIASAIFAIVHPNPQQIINAFFSGLILGYIYYRTRSLIPVIVIHAVNNAIAYILIRQFPDKIVFTMRQLIQNDNLYWIIYGISLVLFLFALATLWAKLKKRDMKPADTVK